MRLKRHIALRWTWIIALCSAHSFFWGAMTHGNTVAMLLALTTVIIGYSVVESSTWFEAQQNRFPMLQKALRRGIKIRLWFVALIAFSYLITLLQNTFNEVWWIAGAVNITSTIEIVIGIAAIAINHAITGVNYDLFQHNPHASEHYDGYTVFVITYVITLITAFLHSIILVMLCALTYLASWARSKWLRAN